MACLTENSSVAAEALQHCKQQRFKMMVTVKSTVLWDMIPAD